MLSNVITAGVALLITLSLIAPSPSKSNASTKPSPSLSRPSVEKLAINIKSVESSVSVEIILNAGARVVPALLASLANVIL